MRFQPKTLFCAVALSSSIPAAMAQHGDHAAHGTPSADQIGSENVSFATSCSPSTADNFNRGVALVNWC